jgi:GNAT superfamily N-acetyltransferase
MTLGDAVLTWDGRYEARDHGLGAAMTSALAQDDGTWLDLPERPEAERAALLGRRVRVHGARVSPTAIDATAIAAVGDLEEDDPIPREHPGRRRAVEVVETSLEMFADRAPALADLAVEPGLAVISATCTVRYYRWLYDAVGGPWQWWNRKRWSDDQLAAYLGQPAIEVHVLHARGAPVGYAELDRREPATCEVAYFGLMPEAIGRGLGRWFLAWTIHAAWSDPHLRRLWVHTCTLDGAAALPSYRKAGFTAFRHTRFRSCIVDDSADDDRPLR